MKDGIAAKVRAAGGEIYGVSSEPQTLAGLAKTEWALDFETLGDPHHDVAGDVRDRGWLDLFVNERLEFLKRSATRADFTPTHPKGYFQPGVLALSREGRVLYRWRGVPTHKNIGGAVERPTASYAWAQIENALESGTSEDASLDLDPELDTRGVPWALFVPLLIANGWFVRPQAFVGGIPDIKKAALRLVAFVAAWIAAFAWLPTLPVAVALAAWVAFIAPKVSWVGKEFQNAEAGHRGGL